MTVLQRPVFMLGENGPIPLLVIEWKLVKSKKLFYWYKNETITTRHIKNAVPQTNVFEVKSYWLEQKNPYPSEHPGFQFIGVNHHDSFTY